MSPNKVNHPSRRDAEALALLAEECAEVVQVVMKALRHGLDSEYRDNRELLAREIGDVLAAIHIAVVIGLLDESEIENAKLAKFERVGKWLHYVEL